jgi:hypothetical protein
MQGEKERPALADWPDVIALSSQRLLLVLMIVFSFFKNKSQPELVRAPYNVLMDLQPLKFPQMKFAVDKRGVGN